MINNKIFDFYIYGSQLNKLLIGQKSIYVNSHFQPITNLVAVTGQACTLRCKDCGNFSPLASSEYPLYDADDIISDLKIILKYTAIKNIQYQGGEPFLHPKLSKLIFFAINDNRIDNCVISTNGTIIPDIDTILLQHKKVQIRISNYPVTSIKAKKLQEYCIKNGINNRFYEFAGNKGMWHDMSRFERDFEHADNRFKNCAFNGCLTLENHRLGYCSRSTIAESVQGFIPKDDDYLEINNYPMFENQLSNYISYPHFMEACTLCNGTDNPILIEPAVQLKR